MTTKDYLPLYLKLGLAPIPLRGKTPLVKWRDYEYNALDFAKPSINIGIKGGLLLNGRYLWFLDLDSRDLLATIYDLLPTGAPIVSTGRGHHVWLCFTEPVKTRRVGRLEIRGEGAYVVVPPSLHPSGKRYQFLRPLGPVIPLLDPETFAKQTTVHNDGRNRPARVPGGSQFTGVSKGQRHTTLVSLLGLLFARHYIEEDALAEMIAWNKKCQPPLPQDELLSTVRSCWDRWDKFEG